MTESFPALEQEVLKFWEDNQVFERSVAKNASKSFVFYDGPPFANGLPHYGHLLTGFLKDVFARYKTMQGFRVERRFGWDCHGLPAEMAAEKDLKVSGRASIEKFGIDKFNQHCRSSVMKYEGEWKKYVIRQGRWVDFVNSYKTMDKDFMESVLWSFKVLYNKGLIYEEDRVLPYSWACETPVSNFETRMDNCYREKISKAITITFTLLEIPRELANLELKEVKLLAWTTTPWTLPSNLALAINPAIKYQGSLKDNILTIHSASYNNLPAEEKIDIDPAWIIGKKYRPLFNYFSYIEQAFAILPGEFVSQDEGTGVVHLAPGFGEDDFNLCKKYNIPIKCPVDNGGKFTQEVPDFVGMQVFSTNDSVIKHLKATGSWVKTESYTHNYPHCWRTDTPLIYRAIPSWYLAVTKIKEEMVRNNQLINWIPHNIRDGQFGKWLESARDWSISRNRFWGSPIPVWKSDDPNYPRMDVYGSIDELERDFKIKVEDLHRPFIDNLVRPNPDDPSGKSMMRRVQDVFDCWFESGSMPYAQLHYPFENKQKFEENFPADFITEYISQTRGWFYTLMVLATALFDQPPFKNCVCHGVVLDIKGQKLSKRLNNYADPMEIFDKFGADALRFVMLGSPVAGGGNLLIDKEGEMLKDALRLVIKPLWSSYHFFSIYHEVDKIEIISLKELPSISIDLYIAAKAAEFGGQVEKALDSYDTQKSCRLIIEFIEILNNWYIRRSRSRFWRQAIDDDKKSAYYTLYTVLCWLLRIAAPLLPFTSEYLWQKMRILNPSLEDSVHLADFPKLSTYLELANLKAQSAVIAMDRARNICNIALSIRNKNNIRVRQPLSGLTIYTSQPLDEEYINIIRDEINVKTVEVKLNLQQAANSELKLNFSEIAKRIGKQIPALMKALKMGEWSIINNSQAIVGGHALNGDEFTVKTIISIPGAELVDEHTVIELKQDLTKELIEEGVARDLVRFIQQTRKKAELSLTQQIKVTIFAEDESLQAVLNNWRDYICAQTLAHSIDLCTQRVTEGDSYELSGCEVRVRIA